MEHKKQKWLEQIYTEKAPIIYKYLLKLGCPLEDAKDIVQYAFTKGIEYQGWEENENFVAWLFKVAIHKYYDLCRSRQKRPEMILEEEHFLGELSQEDGLGLLLQKEHGQQVLDTLSSLGESQRHLLLLKYELGLSYEQIGEMLGTSSSNIKTYLYRARNGFKKQWEEKQDGTRKLR